MELLGLVELQRSSQRVQHAVGDASDIAPLEARVVVDAHTGQHRHLFSAQTRDAAMAVPGRQSGLRRCQLGPPGCQELPNLASMVHGINAIG